ncbi:hypothetical protein PHYPSEUDO_013274 [Phytophthora pseudosyringae]|uniref:Uncharacterized protein n=1 Tax=Phytophthora pseudosyringae TaxID=221518 RepID=A0A8T1W2B4_9STRA|nr:hypothetical protein PHYPSEUDO_013274 [Phytophthora pseudosyringae]
MNALDLLLSEGEDENVVAAAMAFLDSVKSDSEPPTDSTDNNSPSTSQKPKRKRNSKPGYSTEQGRRKKEEVLALRAQVEGLEAWLEHLKRTQQRVSALTRKACSCPKANRQTATKAMEAFQKRQRSEGINRKLKAALASQATVGKAVLAIIQQTMTLEVSGRRPYSIGSNRSLSNPTCAYPLAQDRDFVFCRPEQLAETYENAGVLAQLRDGARGLYMNLSTAVPQLPATAYCSTMAPTIHPIRGKMFESSTVCSVPCSMKFASDALWLEYSTPRKYANKSYRYMDLVGADSVKKSFDLLLQSKRGEISMNGLMFATRFEDEARVSIVRDYVAFLPTAGLHMRCNHWTIVTPGDADHDCHLHFYVQMFAETTPGFLAAPQDVSYVQEIALEAWSTKMHAYSQLLHDHLEINSL